MTPVSDPAVVRPALDPEDELYEVVNGVRVVEPTSPPPGADDDSLYEVVNGQRVELPPMGAYQNVIASILLERLAHFVRTRGLGRAVCETLFTLAAISQERRPNVAYVSYNRWPRNQPVPRTAAWAVTPDLAAEVVSPTNTAQAISDKIHEYFAAGVQQVWVIYPDVREVYIYNSLTDIRVFQRQHELDGGTLLPGFRLPVAALFDDEGTAEANPSEPKA